MAVPDDLRRYDQIDASYIGDHGRPCCALARVGVSTRLRSPSLPSSLARVPVEFEWGPTRWPVHWCELTGEDESAADCGVHAALARGLMQADGVPVRNARIAIKDLGYSIAHWRRSWRQAGLVDTWIGSETVYHETLFVNDRYWDPSEARWFGGVGASLACGTVVATRVDGEDGWTCQGL